MGSWQVSRDCERVLAREVSTKEEIEDSMKPEDEENNMKASIKKVGMGTDGGGRGSRWEEVAQWSTIRLRIEAMSVLCARTWLRAGFWPVDQMLTICKGTSRIISKGKKRGRGGEEVNRVEMVGENMWMTNILGEQQLEGHKLHRVVGCRWDDHLDEVTQWRLNLPWWQQKW